jgi:hypothetical protein
MVMRNVDDCDDSSDDRKIARHLADATRAHRVISDACARVIASQWHDGQASVGYSFASSGHIEESADRVWNDLFGGVYESLKGADRGGADALRAYLNRRQKSRHMNAIPGWSELWL